MAGANPCAITGVLAQDYANAVRTINRKFNALQRLAELLEQLGDLTSFIPPNLSAFIPLYLINLDAYTNLVQACPFLNLPATPSNATTAELQGLVNSAYARVIQKLQQHPIFRLGKLQDQLNKVQTSLNGPLNTGAQFLQCLNQACASGAIGASFVSEVAQDDFSAQIDQYTRTYLANGGKVLTTTAQNKVNELNGIIDNINELRSTEPVATQAASPVPVVPSVPPVPQIPAPPP